MDTVQPVTPVTISQAMKVTLYLCSSKFGEAYFSSHEPKSGSGQEMKDRVMYSHINVGDHSEFRKLVEEHITECIKKDAPITEEGIVQYVNDNRPEMEWYLGLVLMAKNSRNYSLQNTDRIIDDFIGVIRAIANKQNKRIAKQPVRRKR